jgi:hypothetical protein
METAAATDSVHARLPVDTIERIKAEAARRDWSRSQTIARATEIGLSTLEAQQALPFGGEA